MVTYRMQLSDEVNDVAIDIALESPENARRRRIARPVLVVAGVALLACAVGELLFDNAVVAVVYLAVGVVALLFAVKERAFQRFVLRRSATLVDKAFRSGEAAYTFDDEGVTIESDLGHSVCYWNSFAGYGTWLHYLYVKRGDNRIVLVDTSALAPADLDELRSLLAAHLREL